MNEKLKSICQEVGIDCFGVAPIGPYIEVKSRIEDRIDKGYFTGMEEPDIQKRINPKLTMENVKSIIVCAFPYYRGNDKSSNLSKYCQVKDYHIVAKDMLKEVCNMLSKEIEYFEYKVFADNGPLVDRYLASLAGIGYYGLNNNIITDKYGSYIFIGYIMCNYDFEKSKPLSKECIKCRKCEKYCPGNALLGNYEMDPRKCLSYLTQKKEELSEEELKVLKKHTLAFGCDICQDVCPHNKDIETTSISAFEEKLIFNLDIEEIKNISNKEFKRRYKDFAFSWRGKPTVLRNLEIIEETPIK